MEFNQPQVLALGRGRIESKNMYNKSLELAVLFLVFNRLDTTKRVFQSIREAKPVRLYIASDGPRVTHPDEAEKVQSVRKYILENIDWDCDVNTLFQKQNLGCKHAVESAITWLFDNEEMGIILEDDCLPSRSFFPFCKELLEEYKNDKRIMMISGLNKQEKWEAKSNDYIFSHLGGIWGWASWSRAWKLYDADMSALDTILEKHYLRGLLGKKLGKLREKQMMRIRARNIDTWDFHWALSRHMNSGLSCVPSKNLVVNIGFGENATHTVNSFSHKEILNHEIDFPIRKNMLVMADFKYDERYFKGVNILQRIRQLINS